MTISGADRMVMPGLVDIHSHPEHEPAYRGIREEHGLPTMYMSGLFERSQSFFGTDDAFRDASAEFAYCELLKSGVTTLVDISPPWDNWAPLLAKSGLRAYLAPGFASARWKLENDYDLKYLWDEKLGRERFATALKTIDAAAKHPSGAWAAWSRRCRSIPARPNCCATLLRRPRIGRCPSPCTSRRA